MSAKKLKKILEANGWVLVRTSGDHFTYKKHGFEKIVTFNYKKDLSIGLVKSIERITGLSLRR